VLLRITNTHSLEKPGFFSRALLTYTLALSAVLSDEELAAIEQKNIYNRVIYEPPPHPLWQVAEDEDPPAFLVFNLTQLHETGAHAAIGYFNNDHDANIGEGNLRKGLEELKQILSLRRPSFDDFEL
jgi:hypothetical protein